MNVHKTLSTVPGRKEVIKKVSDTYLGQILALPLSCVNLSKSYLSVWFPKCKMEVLPVLDTLCIRSHWYIRDGGPSRTCGGSLPMTVLYHLPSYFVSLHLTPIRSKEMPETEQPLHKWFSENKNEQFYLFTNSGSFSGGNVRQRAQPHTWSKAFHNTYIYKYYFTVCIRLNSKRKGKDLIN